MSLPRRKFLKSSLLFGATAYLLFGNPQQGLAGALFSDGRLSSDVLQDPVFSFTKETFEPYIGGYFQAPNARGQMVALKLLKVDAYKTNPLTKITTARTVQTESFSLLFQAAGPLAPFTNIHKVDQGALGEFRIFMTRRDSQGVIYYEAVFNRTR